MTQTEYLDAVLRSQMLTPGSSELKELQQHKNEVDDLLLAEFGDAHPTLRYGGSKAKGTMIRESYDLDIICYFPHDESGAGETLEDIYNNVAEKLTEAYTIERKSAAIRLKDRGPKSDAKDFHIDVVPGRFLDGTKTDAWIYQHAAEKERLKTNLETHIEHVRDSGVVDAITLMKLWRVRNSVGIRNFIQELLVVDLLKTAKDVALPTQLRYVLKQFRDNIDGLSVEDPANPEGNDLSSLFDAGVRHSLSSMAANSLRALDNGGWEKIFGPVGEEDTTAAMRRVATAIPAPSQHKPWHRGDE
jgi:hypothetical protein